MSLPDREPIRRNEPLSAPARAIFADRVIHSVLDSVRSTPEALKAVFQAWKRPNFATDFTEMYRANFNLEGVQYTVDTRLVDMPGLGAREGLSGARRHIVLTSLANVDGKMRQTVLAANCKYTGDPHEVDETKNVKRFVDGDVTVVVLEDGVVNADLGFDLAKVENDPSDAGAHLYDTEIAMHFLGFL